MVSIFPPKKFDKEEFERQDRRAKTRLIDYLIRHKRMACENPDKFGIDVFEYPDLWHEVEVKTRWTPRYGWPRIWKTVHIPARKMKFIEAERERLTFWVFREDLESALTVNASVVLASPLVVVPNNEGGENERFFDIPFDSCRVVVLGL